MTSDMNPYPVQYDVEYPEGKRNRITTLFRFILIIPALLIAALVTTAAGALSLATVLTILFRGKYPRAWFDWQVEMSRLSARVAAYSGYLRDEYPATDDQQAVTLDFVYPDAAVDLRRGMPLIKWLLVIPHIVVLAVLVIAQVVVSIIAWLVIIFAGFYPRGMFNFSVGVNRWSERVNAYAFMLITDRYPPFSLK